MPRHNYPKRTIAQVRRAQRIAELEREERYSQLEQELHAQWTGQPVEQSGPEVDTSAIDSVESVKPPVVL